MLTYGRRYSRNIDGMINRSDAAAPHLTLARLTADGCRGRARRFAERLRTVNLDAALLCDPHYVNYFTGHWRPGRAIFVTAALIEASGRTTLVAPVPPDDGAFAVSHADETLVYESFRASLVTEDQPAAVVAALGGRLERLRRVGMDSPMHRGVLPASIELVADVRDELVRMRRRKDDDEVRMIAVAVAAGEAALARARTLVRPGLDELDLYAEMFAAAVRATGEPITDYGNDFQFNAFASLPRRRAARSGETIALDVTVGVRGYTCDVCRTFVAGSEASLDQRHAHEVVCDTLEELERWIRPGASCGEAYAKCRDKLRGYRGWKFFHHLGHGVGMWSIERPRINDGSADVFETGDVFAIEPALYDADALRSGVRVEDDYLVTESGIQRLSQFPRDLYCGS